MQPVFTVSLRNHPANRVSTVRRSSDPAGAAKGLMNGPYEGRIGKRSSTPGSVASAEIVLELYHVELSSAALRPGKDVCTQKLFEVCASRRERDVVNKKRRSISIKASTTAIGTGLANGNLSCAEISGFFSSRVINEN